MEPARLPGPAPSGWASATASAESAAADDPGPAADLDSSALPGVLIGSNKSFGEWGQVFGDDVLAIAILDRLLHHCDVIAINGPGYRLKNRLTAIDGNASTAGTNVA